MKPKVFKVYSDGGYAYTAAKDKKDAAKLCGFTEADLKSGKVKVKKI